MVRPPSNDAKQIVGGADLASGSHAYLWTSSGGMQDLRILGGTNSSTTAINRLGQVVGISDIP